jgi:hypothetical protein
VHACTRTRRQHTCRRDTLDVFNLSAAANRVVTRDRDRTGGDTAGRASQWRRWAFDRDRYDAGQRVKRARLNRTTCGGEATDGFVPARNGTSRTSSPPSAGVRWPAWACAWNPSVVCAAAKALDNSRRSSSIRSRACLEHVPGRHGAVRPRRIRDRTAARSTCERGERLVSSRARAPLQYQPKVMGRTLLPMGWLDVISPARVTAIASPAGADIHETYHAMEAP